MPSDVHGNLSDAMKLIIRAPHQTIEDVSVECTSTWTVQQLKAHLAQVYPNKPDPEEQRLIYGGKLLTDHCVLAEILRPFQAEGNSTASDESALPVSHTIHLVCSHRKSLTTETSLPHQVPLTETIPTESLRQRRPAAAPLHPIAPGTPLLAPSYPSWITPTSTALPSSDLMAQQALWMQQHYVQYLTQYMQYMQMSGLPGFVPQHHMSQVTPNSVNAVPVPEERRQAGDGRNDGPDLGAGLLGPGVEGNQVAGEEDAGLRVARDWLDWMYLCSRLLILLAIVYFYSSLSRFLLVFCIGFFVFLYQKGFFRPQRVARFDSIPVPTPQPVPADGEENNNNVQEEAVPVQTSPSSAAWSALVGFFTSLIPEAPPVN